MMTTLSISMFSPPNYKVKDKVIVKKIAEWQKNLVKVSTYSFISFTGYQGIIALVGWSRRVRTN